MNNGLSMLSILNSVSKTLNIAREIIPIYEQIKPIINNSSKILNNFKKKQISTTNIKSSPPTTKEEVIHTSNPTFFQ